MKYCIALHFYVVNLNKTSLNLLFDDLLKKFESLENTESKEDENKPNILNG